MLKKMFRSLTADEVTGLFKSADGSVASRFFRVNWKRNQGKVTRFVVITPIKFHKSAVVRNRMRRQLYALLRQHFSDWTGGSSVAILVKSPALSASSAELEVQLLALLRKSQLVS